MDRDLDQLGAQQANGKQKLDELAVEVQAEREKLAEVREEVGLEKCRAEVVALHSEATVLLAQCLSEGADTGLANQVPML